MPHCNKGNVQGYTVLLESRKTQWQPLWFKVISDISRRRSSIAFIIATHCQHKTGFDRLWLRRLIMIHHFISHLAQVLVQ